MRIPSTRADLIHQTHAILTKYPLTGVGLGNFIPALAQNLPGSHLISENLQPVHNIFLLLLSELGYLPIILVFSLYRIQNTKYEILSNKSIFLLVCLTGFLDHYWLTLPQNRLLLALVIGLL